MLAVDTEAELDALYRRLLEGRVVAFREPDLGEAMTAIAAGPECWRLLSSLSLLR